MLVCTLLISKPNLRRKLKKSKINRKEGTFGIRFEEIAKTLEDINWKNLNNKSKGAC